MTLKDRKFTKHISTIIFNSLQNDLVNHTRQTTDTAGFTSFALMVRVKVRDRVRKNVDQGVHREMRDLVSRSHDPIGQRQGS